MTDTKGFKGHLLTVLVTAVVAIAFLVYLLNLSGAINFGSTYAVKAIVPTAGSLTQGSSVTMAGLRVGTVEGVQRRGTGAVANLVVTDSSIVPIPKDSTATLRQRTPLGENYVEIDPGRSKQKLPAGGLIQMSQSNPYVEVDQILSTLQNGTRNQARQTINALGEATKGEGDDLNGTLRGAAGVLQSGSSITGTLVGQRQEVAQLVSQLGTVASDIGQRTTGIEQIAHQGLTTLRSVSAQDDSLRSFLSILPSTLTQVKTTTNLLGSVSTSAAPVVSGLGADVSELTPAIKNLGPAAREGRQVVAAAVSASRPLESTLRTVTQASPKLTPALPQLTKVVCQVNPVLRFIGPYTADFTNFITTFGEATNSYDGIGHTIRLLPVFGETSAFALPSGVEQAATSLIHEGFLDQAYGLSVNPFPGPGEANQGITGQQMFGPAAVNASGYKYPHVVSDC